MTTCLITGATGAIGPAIVNAFLRAGYPVRILTRGAVNRSLFEGEVEVIKGDLLDASSVDRAVAGIDIVVHLAALLHILNPPPQLVVEYERCNVEGTKYLLDASRIAGIPRFVYFSTIAVYGTALQRPWSEEVEPQPDTFYAQTKLAAERYEIGR